MASNREIPPAAYTISEFCQAHRISVDFYFNLQRRGLGPKVMRLGRRTLISVEAAAQWRRERERMTAQSDKQQSSVVKIT
jgi:hypothetical protein